MKQQDNPSVHASPNADSISNDLNRASLLQQIIVTIAVLFVLIPLWFFLAKRASGTSGSTHDQPKPKTDGVSITSAGVKATQITVLPVKQTNAASVINATGVILFPQDQNVKISPRLQGRIRNVYVKVGDKVSTGQVIADFDSVDAVSANNNYKVALTAFNQAKVNLERSQRLYKLGTPEVTSAQLALDQAKIAESTAKDFLTRTKEQAVIGGFSQKPLEDAENGLIAANTTLGQAQADLRLSQKDVERKSKLVEIGVASRADLEQAISSNEKNKLNVKAAQDVLLIAKQALDREQKAYKSNLYSNQQVAAAESAYRQSLLQTSGAERALQLAKAAINRDLQQSKSDFNTAKSTLNTAQTALKLIGSPGSDGIVPITSPINGIVTERNVNPGQIVDQTQMTPWQMFTISNNSSVWVDLDIYEKDISAVKTNQPVTIRPMGDPSRSYVGKISSISPVIDPKTRTMKARTILQNPRGDLRDGMYVNGTITMTQLDQMILIPASAVRKDGNRTFVYIPNGPGYKQHEVKLSEQVGDSFRVISGLSVNDKIVQSGALFIDAAEHSNQ